MDLARWLAAASVWWATASCGGTVEVEGPGSGGAGGAGGVGNTGAGTTSSTSSNSSSSGGGSTPPKVTIENATLIADCAPIIAPDPLTVTFDLVADHEAGTSSSTLVMGGGVVTLQGSPPGLFEFDIDPETFVVDPGQVVVTLHAKVPGSLTGALSPCAYCGAQGELQVAVVIDGMTGVFEAVGLSLLCAL